MVAWLTRCLDQPGKEGTTLSTTGCGFLFLAALALVAGMIPFLTWTNLVVTLPLAVIGTIAVAAQARKPAAQPADRAMLWLSIGFTGIVLFRLVMM